MKRKIIFLILFGGFLQMPHHILAQPTPGDTGLGAASGNVVGGGADLGGDQWYMLVLSCVFLAYILVKRYREKLKAGESNKLI